jgi:hypothetical protein
LKAEFPASKRSSRPRATVESHRLRRAGDLARGVLLFEAHAANDGRKPSGGTKGFQPARGGAFFEQTMGQEMSFENYFKFSRRLSNHPGRDFFAANLEKKITKLVFDPRAPEPSAPRFACRRYSFSIHARTSEEMRADSGAASPETADRCSSQSLEI